jgi:ASC-1-like (ASCH) protein
MKQIWQHELKIEKQYYEKVVSGDKTFEIRKNDRDFKTGDIIKLNEIAAGYYTGESTTRVITYICNYEQKDNYVVLAIQQ